MCIYPRHTGSFKSPVQLLLQKKTCFPSWLDSLSVAGEHKQVTADALIAGIYSGNSDKSSPLWLPLPHLLVFAVRFVKL